MNNNKPKEIIEFITEITTQLSTKLETYKNKKDLKIEQAYCAGQLFEAHYLLDKIWHIATK